MAERGLRGPLDGLLASPGIKSFLNEFPSEAEAVESDLYELLRGKASVSITESAAERTREEQLLTEFRSEAAETLAQRWKPNGRFRRHLAKTYDQSEMALEPFDTEASRIRRNSSGGKQRACEAWKLAIVQKWRAALQAKLQREKTERENARDLEVAEQMEVRFSRYRQLHQLLAPIQGYLALSWDLSSSELHESFFDVVKRSDAVMRNGAKIRAIAERLGRLQEAEHKYFDQSMAALPKPESWTFQRAARSSVIGIHESDDLSSIVSSEAVLLSSPETESLFFLKFAEKKLVTYDFQPEERSRAQLLHRRRRKSPVQRRGPIILAVDTSASMQGEAEQDAKALALALTRVAFYQDRAVHVISFSSQADEITLLPTKRGSLEKLVRFLLMSFHGGTDLEVALGNALRMLKGPNFHKADMVFLTDGQAPKFNEERVAAMNEARNNGARFYGLLVGDLANRDLLAQFDFNWQYRGVELMDVADHLEQYRRRKL